MRIDEEPPLTLERTSAALAGPESVRLYPDGPKARNSDGSQVMKGLPGGGLVAARMCWTALGELAPILGFDPSRNQVAGQVGRRRRYASRDWMIRARAVPVAVALLAVIALIAVVLLQSEARDSRGAELKLANLKAALTGLQSAPFQASPSTGGSPARARTLIRDDKDQISAALGSLRKDSPPPSLSMIAAPLRANYAALDRIYLIGASGADYGSRADHFAGLATRADDRVKVALAAASDDYDGLASTAETHTTEGSALTIGLLLAAFLFFYRRSTRSRRSAQRLAGEAQRLAEENESLAASATREARTDALTGLGNRRALADHLAAESQHLSGAPELALALFDLDGFKQYNDTFGHPAGDSLLARLGERLGLAVGESGSAYRMGGDEFCLLARIEPVEGEALVQRGAAALQEVGEGFRIECSYGLALMPAEARSTEEALQLADRRLYEDKAGRSSAGRQSADVLLEVMNERSPDLREHIRGVAEQAAATAERLSLPEHEISRIALAAELHDIGKAAIPDSILNKPEGLDEGEVLFMNSHTVIGERIVLAAPSLAPLGDLVRSSHEHFDGGGYPDGLRGLEIHRGAAIIAVCDAFDAMVGGRPYRGAIGVGAAVEELRRCTGTQFEPDVVDAFLGVLADTGSTVSLA
jgi:diguanylate cyclase (GGDEF)-like protein